VRKKSNIPALPGKWKLFGVTTVQNNLKWQSLTLIILDLMTLKGQIEN
jgi:hypothetical protein